MTALTPQQMRELARMDPIDDDALLSPREWIETARADLRAAADQLDAVQRFASVRATAAHALGREAERDWLDLLAILTAGTAPQDLS